jgi:lipoate-protein ligase B
VGWPVVALQGEERDVHAWLRLLEEALIRTVADFGIRAFREPGLTGVWTAQGKIAAIGVRLAHGWITSHGFALNVAADVSGFSAIVPCGIRGRGVASLAGCGSGPVDLADVGRIAASRLAEGMGRRLLAAEAA